MFAAIALAMMTPTGATEPVTDCDVLISHPDDPMRVAEGVSREEADLPAAVAACEEAVSADPENPRLNYQLARALGYSGRGEEALPYRAKAVEGNYPQALFVVGFITLYGMNGQPQDRCEAASLIHRSAEAGRLAGLVGLPDFWLSGAFEGCELTFDPQDLPAYLDRADEMVSGDFYKGLMVKHLKASLAARLALGTN